MHKSTNILLENNTIIKNKKKRGSGLVNEIKAIGFIIPFFIVFLVFYLLPLGKGLYMSLYKWGILGKKQFVGFNNYLKVLTDREFYISIGHSLYFVLLSVPIIILLGLFLALIVNQNIRLKTLIRSIYFLPYVLSVSVASFLWLRMLDSNNGLLNAILRSLGVTKQLNWLTDTKLVWWSIVITTAWWTVGFVMVLFLAGLQEIPTQLYEAADIDGANSIQKFLHITLPGLSRVMRIQIFFQIIAGLKLFGQPHIMLNGGPGDATHTVIREIYMTAFKKDAFGLGSAQSILFCLFMLIIAAVQYKFINLKNE